MNAPSSPVLECPEGILAQNTERMRLGTCVTNPATREPSVTASTLAVLQLLDGLLSDRLDILITIPYHVRSSDDVEVIQRNADMFLKEKAHPLPAYAPGGKDRNFWAPCSRHRSPRRRTSRSGTGSPALTRTISTGRSRTT